MRKIAILPTLLTLGNGVCGFASITMASKIFPGVSPEHIDRFFAAAGWLIIFAMVFDVLDGYVARLSKTASKFGGELDSLCDAVSFGVAPAFLLLKMGPGWEPNPFLHQLLAGIAALYMVCTILRLARFNVDNTPDPDSHKRFRGLPSPGAAGCLASLAIVRGDFPGNFVQLFSDVSQDALRQTIQRSVEIFSPMGALVVALLMVSIVPFPHFGKQFRGKRHGGLLIQILLAVLVIVMVRDLAFMIIFWGYAFFFPLRAAYLRYVAPPSQANPRPEGGIS
ncbi:MAG: CDP-diacylglycerol--serine O-phosphatidyltransferase [Gemmataceae bacterium]|nr:CDP-diacylglycerol--serine O-phosphatidyltransferase [Gemmataceae bacterium]